MMKIALTLAVLGLANAQAPTATEPGNQCDIEMGACEDNAECLAVFENANWSPEGGEGQPPDCVGSAETIAQCTALLSCVPRMTLFHEARGPFRGGCEFIATDFSLGLRAEADCPLSGCKWCAADAACDSQLTDMNGNAIASCTYDPAAIFGALANAATAGATLVSYECAMKDAQAQCERVDQDCSRNPAYTDEVCNYGTDPASYDPAASDCQSICTDLPATCAWVSGECGATMAAITAATEEFKDSIAAADAAGGDGAADKASHAAAAGVLPISAAVAALYVAVY